jgi:hypothetical protein
MKFKETQISIILSSRFQHRSENPTVKFFKESQKLRANQKSHPEMAKRKTKHIFLRCLQN